MSDFTVTQHGIDSSGRAILMTNYMADWFETICSELGWRPVIIQGAFMSRVPGGGAKDSSGYHDLGGCLDLRTRDLSTRQIDALNHAVRWNGAGGWRRDQSAAHGGMDPHYHLTLGSDRPLSSGADTSWRSYLSGGDGLAGPGADYEERPNPLVLTPPEVDDVKPEDIEAVAKQILDEETVELRKPDGSTKKISVRNALTRILNEDGK